MTSSNGETSLPAPSLHQDGYEYSLHLNVSRKNIQGGESILSPSSHEEDIFCRKILSEGEYIFFDDKMLHHTATAIKSEIGEYGYRDMIIFDFIKK